MENEIQGIPEIPKKKAKLITLGLPIVLGLALVLAITYIAYNHSFTKTLNVYMEGGSSEYVSISGSGDISSSVINCVNNGLGCSSDSGTITLTNSDTNPHYCTVTTTGSDKVTTSYNKEVVPITVPASGSIDFVITYKASETGQYPMTTTISCP